MRGPRRVARAAVVAVARASMDRFVAGTGRSVGWGNADVSNKQDERHIGVRLPLHDVRNARQRATGTFRCLPRTRILHPDGIRMDESVDDAAAVEEELRYGGLAGAVASQVAWYCRCGSIIIIIISVKDIADRDGVASKRWHTEGQCVWLSLGRRLGSVSLAR